jgi:hypothetical protein
VQKILEGGNKIAGWLYYDFVPTGEDRILLFILNKRAILSVNPMGDLGYEDLVGKYGTAMAIAVYEVREAGNKDVLLEIIPVNFREPFHAFRRGDDYYFVLDSGKVYIARKPTKGERTLELLWDDPNRPVVAILDDVDRGETFVFAKNKRAVIGAKDCYFALADKPRVVEFSPFDLTPVKAPEPLRTVTQYARLLAVKGSPPK